MAIPDYQEFMRPLLEAIADGAANVKEALPIVALKLGLSQEEQQELMPNGRKTFVSDRAHWARTYLSKAGLLESPRRNVHVITERGRTALAEHPDRIDTSVLRQFDGFADWVSGAQSGPTEVALRLPSDLPSQTPDTMMDTAFREIEIALTDELLQEILRLSPSRFERLILDLLRAMGYGGDVDGMYRETPRSGDGGFDGVIDEDALGLDAVYIQAKRYAPDNKVGRPALQAFVGSLTGEGASKGVFVTTSDFSREAVEYVRLVQQRIVLINGDRLARLMIAHDVGVRARKTYILRSVDEDYFADTD